MSQIIILFIIIMNMLAIFLGAVGPWQIAVVVVLIVLLFGGKKIPELMRGLGSGIKEFKDAARDDQPANSRNEQSQKEENKL